MLYFGWDAEAHKSKARVLDPSSDNINVSGEQINSESRMWHAKESLSNSCKSDDMYL